MEQTQQPHWEHFKIINSQRRAIRDFDGTPIPDQDIRDILQEALRAPSSGNIQPYRIHWIQDPALKARVAEACNGQRAATSASALFVLVASKAIAKQTLVSHAAYLENSDLSANSKSYHQQGINTLKKFLRFGPFKLWTPLIAFFSVFAPVLSLFPVGGLGMRQWLARNSIYAAQNILLASVAKGYDACPMEGFNALKIASILQLPYGSVIPVVIAIGKKQVDARTEPQWRKSFEEVVVVH